MKNNLRYIEHKSGQANHSGTAWIGFVEFSNSGRTVYFNDMALKAMIGGGDSGNYYNIETGEEYWISGVKKNGNDRHKFGRGIIFIDKNAVQIYLKYLNIEGLDLKKFKPVDIQPTDKQRFMLIENRTIF